MGTGIHPAVQPGSPLRVALITETWSPEINGVAMTLQRLVHGLQCICGDTLQVVRPAQSHIDRAFDEEHILRRGLAIPGYAGLQLGLPSYHALISRWRSNRPDIVHVATEGPLGYSALLAAENLDIAVSSSFHTNFHTYFKHYRLGLLSRFCLSYLRRFHNRCACTMVPTAVQALELADEGFNNTRVLSRGIDTELFRPDRRDPALRTEWGLRDDDLAILSVGRLAAEKNLALLAKTFATIRATRPTAKLILVGDGPERAIAEAIDGSVVVGVKRGDDLARHYASADIFPFASLSETYGNVLTEAMASGLACVAFDYAAAAEVIEHDVNALKCARDDNERFIAMAVELAGDRDRRLRLANLAPSSIANRSWANVIIVFRNLLVEAIERKSARLRLAG